MKITNEHLSAAAKYVQEYMAENFSEKFVFHTFRHTTKVVRVCDILSMESGLGKRDRHIVHLAGWFCNIAYHREASNHEEHSAKQAKIFFEQLKLDKEDIEEIAECILATKNPQHPQTETARILCDAVLYHLSDAGYFDELKLIRKEWELVQGKIYPDEDWYKENIEFLNNHFYYTAVARKNYEKSQRNNLARLKGQLAIIKHSSAEVGQGMFDEQKNLFDSNTKLERGVESMFRIASDNQMQLSQMGDGKANILISVNSIIITITLSLIVRSSTIEIFFVPSIILIIVCLTTIVLATLSIRPKISEGTFTPQQIINKEANLLFFGNFHKMPLQEYKSAVKEMMIDKEYLYESLIMDIYYKGKVLARKYRFTTWAYNVFMFGLCISVFGFLISYIIYHVNN